MATWVRVERNRLTFMAAHMATFRGEVEPLHGHNYAVLVECEGPPTADAWVIDFGHVKREMKALCDELDHKFLLQRPSALMEVRDQPESIELLVQGERRYLFPRAEVLALPIANSTAEELARWLHERLCRRLQDLGVDNLTRVAVGVEEAPGQTGWYAGAFPEPATARYSED